jgi:hypothetical protein
METELDYARSIRDDELPSPQRVNNMWLFDLRITGTGTAYRKKSDSYVYREPDNFLNDEFLARCNGLTVVWEHPEKNKLSSEEFKDRAIGSVMLPYIKGNEVWAIARIYDDEAANDMIDGNLSTSPTVIFDDILVNDNIIIDEYYHVMIEGNPSIIDHLAICESGVWDKGGEPSGIIVNNEEVKTVNENEEKDEIIADAAEVEKPEGDVQERILSLIEKLAERLDKIEAKDAAPAAVEEHKEDMPDQLLKLDGDAEGGDKKEEAFADAQIATLKKQIAELNAKIPRSRSNEDYDALAIAQSRAEAHYGAFGDSASVCRPMDGETVLGYRKRMAKGLQKHSEKYGKIDIAKVIDDAVLAIVEEGIYADSMVAARAPTAQGMPNGMPRAIKGTDEVGRPFTHYTGGEPLKVFSPFRQKPRHISDLRQIAHTTH